jgi:hypothetical protein
VPLRESSSIFPSGAWPRDKGSEFVLREVRDCSHCVIVIGGASGRDARERALVLGSRRTMGRDEAIGGTAFGSKPWRMTRPTRRGTSGRGDVLGAWLGTWDGWEQDLYGLPRLARESHAPCVVALSPSAERPANARRRVYCVHRAPSGSRSSAHSFSPRRNHDSPPEPPPGSLTTSTWQDAARARPLSVTSISQLRA